MTLAACIDSSWTCARDPEVDRACKAVVAEAVSAVEGDADVGAVVLTGSLTRGAACGTILDGAPSILSDVDMVVVPRPDASPDLRGRLARVSGEVTGACRHLGLVSHVEYGLLSRRTLSRPKNRLFLHDLARTGITLAGNPEDLETLRARLAGQRVDPEEGRILVLNRIAGQVYMLGHVASPEVLDRLVARYQFAKAYADSALALRIVEGRYDDNPFRHGVLDRQAGAARKWEAFRADPPLDPGTGPDLLEEWRATVRDQLSVAEACGALARTGRRAPSLAHALAWSRLAGARPPLKARLGLDGSPLRAAHLKCAALARHLVDGRVDPAWWSARARTAVGFWRTAGNGSDDTPKTYTERVSGLLRRVS